MRQGLNVRMLFTVGVLVGSLALLGCPKRPEVASAGPGAAGPGAAVTPAQPGAAAPGLGAAPGVTPGQPGSSSRRG